MLGPILRLFVFIASMPPAPPIRITEDYRCTNGPGFLRHINLPPPIKPSEALVPKTPVEFLTIEEAQKIIARELESQDNSLILVTAGVGKTHVTLEYLVNNLGDRTVIYSCFNRDLKKEAYEKAKSFNPDATNLFLLQAKEECCLNKPRLMEVTDAGFSPGILLMPSL